MAPRCKRLKKSRRPAVFGTFKSHEASGLPPVLVCGSAVFAGTKTTLWSFVTPKWRLVLYSTPNLNWWFPAIFVRLPLNE